MTRRIAQNLVEPDEACARQITIETQRKRAQQKRRCVVRPRVRRSHQLVRRAMALSPSQWQTQVQKIRAFTTEWLSY